MIFQKYNIFFELILFFSSFCYMKFFNIGTNTDLQLYYFIVCIGFLIMTLKKINKEILISTLILLILLTYNLFIDYKNLFSFFRGSYAYISFVVVSYAIYKLCKKIDLKIFEKRIKFYFFIWNIVGIIQIFDNSLITFWRYRTTIEGGRGSISFGNEPAYYVFFLILSSTILYSINKKNKHYFFISLVFSGILAKSFTGTFYLLIIVFIAYLNKENILKIILISIMITLLIIFFSYNISEDTDYRILKLLRDFVRNPYLLILKDGSARARVITFFFSIKGSLEHFFLPNGFSTWDWYTANGLVKYKDLFLLNNNEIQELEQNIAEGVSIFKSNNINSMFGGIIYELGFVGLFFYYYIYKICLDKKNWVIIMILSIDGLNITNPYLAILLGINYFLYKNRKKLIRGYNK